MLRIITILFPIFSIVAIAYVYARRYATDMQVANRLNIDIFTPALLFSVLADKSFHVMTYQSLAIGGIVIVLGSGLLAYPITRWQKLSPNVFVLPMMFTNTGNMGLPLAVFSFGESALPAAVMLFVIENTLHFTIGMFLINHRIPIWQVLRMPIIVATLMGLLVSSLQWSIPEVLLAPIKMLGQISVPLMLFGLGVRLLDIDFSDWKIGLLGAITCPLVGIGTFLLISPWLTLSDMQRGLLLVFSVLPPAVLNYMIAEQYQLEPRKVASIVLIGNIFSVISLPMALSFALTSL
jgi:predicted permease